MKNLFFCSLPLLLLACGPILELSSLALQESEDSMHLAKPMIINPAKNLCSETFSFTLKNRFSRFATTPHFSAGFSVDSSDTSWSSTSSVRNSFDLENIEQCLHITSEFARSYSDIKFAIRLNTKEVMTKYQAADPIKVNSTKAYLELTELGPYSEGVQPIISEQDLELILDCPEDFELRCMDNLKPYSCKYFQIKSFPNCLFAIKRQPLKVYEGKNVLLSLEGRLSKDGDGARIDVYHLSFD